LTKEDLGHNKRTATFETVEIPLIEAEHSEHFSCFI